MPEETTDSHLTQMFLYFVSFRHLCIIVLPSYDALCYIQLLMLELFCFLLSL